MTTTILPQIGDLAHTPLAGSLDDLLLTVFDAGVAAGAGWPCERHPVGAIDALIETVRARWFGELRAGMPADVALPTDAPDVPAWLAALQEPAHVGS